MKDKESSNNKFELPKKKFLLKTLVSNDLNLPLLFDPKSSKFKK